MAAARDRACLPRRRSSRRRRLPLGAPPPLGLLFFLGLLGRAPPLPPLLLLPTAAAAVVRVNLTVDVLRFTSPPVNFTTRAFNGRLGGPLVRVQPGDTLRIRLTNRLAGPPSPGPDNWFQLPNTTNLHLHGMHVSPAGQADDVFRTVSPNTTAEYEYAIPDDHPTGLFWYHPHVHGSSSNQQGGGMAGALVVEPTDAARQAWPAALRAMQEQVLLLQHLCFHDRGAYQSAAPYINHLEVVKYGLDMIDPAAVFAAATTPDWYFVNGQFRPTLAPLRPGEFQLLRLVGAGTSAFLELQIVASASPSPPPCDIFVVAKDGIFVPKAYPDQHPLLVPGARIDMAVRCQRAGNYSLVSARTAQYDAQLAATTVVFEGTLAALVVCGAPLGTPMAPPSALPARPGYLPDLRSAAVPSQGNKFVAHFHTVGGPWKPGPPFPQMLINGKAFAGKDVFAHNMSLGTLQEWVVGIEGDSNVGAGNHPFHMHTNHFQVVAISGSSASGTDSVLGVRVGEYRDTLPLWQSGDFTIRFVPDSFVGRALVHCHMIPHVDLGMALVVGIAGDNMTGVRAADAHTDTDT